MRNLRWPGLAAALIVVFLSTFLVSAQTDSPTLETIEPDNANRVVTLKRIDFGSGVALAPSPDGRKLALAGTQGLWLYDSQTVNKPPIRLGDVTGVNAVAYHPEWHVLAAGGNDGIITFWQVDDKREIQRIEESDSPITAVAYHPDGNMFASGDAEGAVKLWPSLSIPDFAMRFEGHEAAVTSLAFSADGRFLMSGAADGSLGYYDAEHRTRMGNGSDVGSPVHAVAFNPAAEQIAVGTSGSALLVDMRTDAVTTLNTGTTETRTIAYSPDGTMLATPAFLGSVSLWDTVTGELAHLGVPPEDNLGVGDPLSMAFSPDGSVLYVLYESSNAPTGSLLRVWDMTTGTVIDKGPTSISSFQNVIFSPEGRYLVAVGHPTIGKNIIHIWDAATFQEGVRLASPLGEKAIAFSRNGRFLASSGNVSIIAPPEERDAQNEIRLWDTDTWEVVGTLDGHQGFVQSLTWHPQYSNVLAAGTGVTTDDELNGIYVWLQDTGELLPPMDGHTSWVNGLTFTPDGSLLFSAGDKSVGLWNWQSGSLVQDVPFEFSVSGVAVSPDNARLAVANTAGTGITRELTAGEAEYELLPGYVGTTATNVAFNPAGTLLAMPDTDLSDILLFDLVNRRPAGVLKGHSNTVYNLAFNPAGTVLASASADGTILLWGIPSEE